MSYNSIVQMAQSESLANRITAAAASEGIPDPVGWTRENTWKFATQEGGSEAWAYAFDNLNANQNPDIGYRTDVISDEQILAAVQALNPEVV